MNDNHIYLSIEDANELPDTINGLHESNLQSWNVLLEVTQRLERGDSKESVLSYIYQATSKSGEDIFISQFKTHEILSPYRHSPCLLLQRPPYHEPLRSGGG